MNQRKETDVEFCIDAEQLRKAIEEIEAAEENGFDYCLAVFRITTVGGRLDNCRARYSDLIERAHPTDGRLDWGRLQGVSKRFKFSEGKLIPQLPKG